MSRKETLTFPPTSIPPLTPYLPPLNKPKKPWVTLTYATSLDASLSLAPGVRTTLSGPHSKAMTHYLRTQHAAILVGVGTAMADDPALNSRLEGIISLDQQPRPIILDPRGRWAFTAENKVFQLAARGEGKAPFILVSREEEEEEEEEEASITTQQEQEKILQSVGGKYIPVEICSETRRFRWRDVLKALAEEELDSVMVEGGGEVINSLLVEPENQLVDSVIVTIAPTWLGQGGVVVSPTRKENAPQLKLREVSWQPHGEDVVLCGKISRT
ncbi:dihydrofolate reductase-like domain-containing protein [Podospora australis]|uniref:2,5-diamino-6-ribosylamino-4(3H)-pyrimidinone 5'-phosphate reductase n=1 Tax=Podospora australis TaxID=1536484 RepID=A0AAN6X5G8_9PEZI|nr:dihydrofolate reductase-like domain-containing protein [Podospora australis]